RPEDEQRLAPGLTSQFTFARRWYVRIGHRGSFGLHGGRRRFHGLGVVHLAWGLLSRLLGSLLRSLFRGGLRGGFLGGFFRGLFRGLGRGLLCCLLCCLLRG